MKVSSTSRGVNGPITSLSIEDLDEKQARMLLDFLRFSDTQFFTCNIENAGYSEEYAEEVLNFISEIEESVV